MKKDLNDLFEISFKSKTIHSFFIYRYKEVSKEVLPKEIPNFSLLFNLELFKLPLRGLFDEASNINQKMFPLDWAFSGYFSNHFRISNIQVAFGNPLIKPKCSIHDFTSIEIFQSASGHCSYVIWYYRLRLS